MHTRTALIALTSLLALGASGCTIGGSAEPQESAEQTSTDDAFTIAAPKNLKAVPDPCQLLSPEQLNTLAASNPQPRESEWGQAGCTWRNQQLRIDLSPDTIQGGGIRYAAKMHGENEQPTSDVNGYPAVHGFVNDLTCGTFVGTKDKELLLVSFTTGSEGRGNPEYQDPCAMADKIAGMVIENLPPA